MKAAEIRESFLKYFESKAHQRVKSSSLIPAEDPTLLFTNAGMVQFKNLFIGVEQRAYKRAATSQKCLRISGKHNDLENVGETARHHTFFEMLGNFSFGDYFKKDACRFAWDFLIDVLRLDPARMYISVYKDDDEAWNIWHKEIGIGENRLVRLGEKDNYWAMGDTGPQGPCSELIYDQGPKVGCLKPECSVYCNCDRHLELWNLVFMQFNKDDKGNVTKLPKPSIDTGMGLERIAAVKQGVYSNYESDLFQAIISRASKISGVKYGASASSDKSLRVIADHARATAFLIADGEIPSNSMKGYVVRRIMRRAARHGKLIGLSKPFLWEVIDTVIAEMRDAYPDLAERRDYIEKVVRAEEEQFLVTLDRGMGLYLIESEKIKNAGETILPGPVVFKLYDTYGFPRDLTEVVAKEDGLEIDVDGFESEMEAQRERSRSGSDISEALGLKSGYMDLQIQIHVLNKTEFTGYETTNDKSKILALIVGGANTDKASGIDTPLTLISEKTPFYPESGGQIGDTGSIKGNNFLFEVTATEKLKNDVIAHSGYLKMGSPSVGDDAEFIVDAKRRLATARHHTATHLLQAALRAVLGAHVHQRGSKVEPERFRFDFSHIRAMTPEEVLKAEDIVNEAILDNMSVEKFEMSYDDAKKAGATALFGEKYGDIVRMVKIDEFSKELCGGTHVDRTGDIGLFKIIQETAIGSGERRITAHAGKAALDYFRERETALDKAAAFLKADDPRSLPDRVQKLQDEIRKLRKDLDRARSGPSGGGAADPLAGMKEINGVKAICVRVDSSDAKSLRDLSDRLMERLGSGIVVLGAELDGKANLVVKVSKDLTDKYKAGEIIGRIAALVGGKGGGRPDMAQAGGPDAAKLDAAIEEAYNIIAKI